MDTPMHIQIAEAAVDWLTGDCANFWNPFRRTIAKASNYPDYFAAGERTAEKNTQTDTAWREYNMIPNTDHPVVHAIFDPKKIRETYPAVINHWFEKIIENIKSGENEKAAKFIGTLSHIIGDTGQAAHTFDERPLKKLMPLGDKCFVIHSTIEKVMGKIETKKYEAKVLANSIEELNWQLIEELEILKQSNTAEVIPILKAIMDGDNVTAEASASRSLTSCAKLFADVLFTTWNIAFNKDIKLEDELKIQRLIPLCEHCDMLFNYGIMQDCIPGKTINEAVKLNLGAGDMRGIALLTDMAQSFKEERKAFVEYSIPCNTFKYFETEIGLNHYAVNKTKAIFKVKLDNKTVFTSEPLGKDNFGVKIKIKLGDAQRIQLYVCDARPAPCDTKFFYPIFANPKLTGRF
jgi:NPCBM/NEW2 domain